jgi:DNA replication protein DnaC
VTVATSQLCVSCQRDPAIDPGELCADCRRDIESRQQQRIEKALDRLPAALRHWHVGQLDGSGVDRVRDACRRFATGELPGLMFTGPVGTGKTTRAAVAMRMSLEHEPRRPRWLSVPLALLQLEGAFDSPDRKQVLSALTERPATVEGRVARPLGPLALDDLDKTSPSKRSAEILFTTIDVCVTHGRPLIVTTNLMPSELAAKWPQPFGEAIASRLVGYCEIHALTGADRRKRGRA